MLSELGEAEWSAAATSRRRPSTWRRPARTAGPGAAAGPRARAAPGAVFASGRLRRGATTLLEREMRHADAADPRTCGGWRPRSPSIGLLHPATVDRATLASRFATLRQHAGRAAAGGRRLLELRGGHRGGDRRARPAGAGRRPRAGGRRRRLAPDLRGALGARYADAHELALSVLDDTLADARARGSVFGISTSCALRALIALQRGDVTTAEQEARTAPCSRGCRPSCARRCSGRSRWRCAARGSSTAPRRAIAESGCGPEPARVRLPQPRLPRPRRAAARAGPLRGGARPTSPSSASARARIALRNPGDPWRLGAAECLRAPRLPGRGGRARRRAARARAALGHARPRSASRCTGTRSRTAADPAALREAATCSRARRRGSTTRAASWTSARRCGAPTSAPRAREPLREGLELARRCGADALAGARTTSSSSRAARPRRLMFSGPDALTPSERRVAELAADGMSNRDIAQLLFVTTKTVDNHLGAGLRQARDLLARGSSRRRSRRSRNRRVRRGAGSERLREQYHHPHSPRKAPPNALQAPPLPRHGRRRRRPRRLARRHVLRRRLAGQEQRRHQPAQEGRREGHRHRPTTPSPPARSRTARCWRPTSRPASCRRARRARRARGRRRTGRRRRSRRRRRAPPGRSAPATPSSPRRTRTTSASRRRRTPSSPSRSRPATTRSWPRPGSRTPAARRRVHVRDPRADRRRLVDTLGAVTVSLENDEHAAVSIVGATHTDGTTVELNCDSTDGGQFATVSDARLVSTLVGAVDWSPGEVNTGPGAVAGARPEVVKPPWSRPRGRCPRGRRTGSGARRGSRRSDRRSSRPRR